MNTESEQDMFCLNIFERAVQDPCCEGCDCEDDDFCQGNEQSDEEHDPLEEEIRTATATRLASPAASSAATEGAATATEEVHSSPKNPLVRHRSSPTTPVSRNGRTSRSRANSATLIRQISRQSTFEAAAPPEMSIEEGQRMDFAPQQQPQPAQRTKSSCSGIPTHLYGLEKYVSSALDALSTCDYEPSPASAQSSSIISSPLLSDVSSFSNPNSNSSLNSLTNWSASFSRPKKPRKKSFIELSLANSFSQ